MHSYASFYGRYNEADLDTGVRIIKQSCALKVGFSLYKNDRPAISEEKNMKKYLF